MPDGHRRSRTHWDDAMDETPSGVAAHTHRLPPMVRIALIGLTVAVFLALVGIGLMAGAVYKADQYVQGRGEYRDREAERMEQESEESLRRAICDLLDQLPEGGLLNRPREKYGCGPGIPLDQLPPDEADRLRQQRGGQTATPTAPTSSPPAPPARSVPPAAQPPRAAPGPTAPPAAPSSTTPSVVDLGPVTDLACDSVRICF